MNPPESEQRLAEALDTWLAARLAGAPAGPAPFDTPLAAELAVWAETARPAPDFATALGTQLHAAAIRRKASPARTARPARSTRRRLVWALAAVLGVALLGLLAVPSVRADLAELIQIGVIRIFQGPPPVPTLPMPASTSSPEAPPGRTAPRPTATRSPTAAVLSSVLDLVGETSFESAVQRAAFPLTLPAYPADLGQPDHVFLQDLDGPAAVLVWLDPADPDRVRLSLHLLSSEMMGMKTRPRTVAEAEVNGQRALWTTGPYVLSIRRQGGEDWDLRRLVDGHVLIWTDAAVTYRLETDLSLAEAVKVAESLEEVARE